MARTLACKIGYRYIDSGAMYRAVALYALKNGMIGDDNVIDTDRLFNSLDRIRITFEKDSKGKQLTFLNGINVENDIREMAVSRIVSQIASFSRVREEMVNQQRAMGLDGGIVMDGRDIGTTVFPDAQLKIFVTAAPEVRAERRYEELLKKGECVDFNEVLENVKKRDYLDEHRDVSPLRKAEDAILLDNTSMSVDEQNSFLLKLFQRAVGE